MEKTQDDIWNKKKIKSLPQITEKILLNFVMYKKGFITKNKRFFQICKDKIIYYQVNYYFILCVTLIQNQNQALHQPPKGYIHFDFDLNIQWLTKPSNDKNQELRIITGLKLTKFHKTSTLLFLPNQTSEEKNAIIKFFKHSVNQQNFHEFYRTLKKIGKGNFANVYLAENIETGLQYAVKVFCKEIISSQEKGKASIINEINIMRSLEHPNIIKLIEVYETANSIYMVLELLQGGSLQEQLKANYKFQQNEIKNILTGIVLAVMEMTKNGIMHRDIKPDNILFREGIKTVEDICLADLGLAAMVKEKNYLFTKYYLMKLDFLYRCGTPGYVAPEIINMKDSIQYDCCCDVFSAGIVFHQLLFGKSPFKGKTYNEVLTANKQCSLHFTENIYYKIPKTVNMLHKNPHKRIACDQILEHPYFSSENFNNFSFFKIQEQSLVLILMLLIAFYQLHLAPINGEIIFEDLDEHLQSKSSNISQILAESQTKFDMRKINALNTSPPKFIYQNQESYGEIIQNQGTMQDEIPQNLSDELIELRQKSRSMHYAQNKVNRISIQPTPTTEFFNTNSYTESSQHFQDFVMKTNVMLGQIVSIQENIDEHILKDQKEVQEQMDKYENISDKFNTDQNSDTMSPTLKSALKNNQITSIKKITSKSPERMKVNFEDTNKFH